MNYFVLSFTLAAIAFAGVVASDAEELKSIPLETEDEFLDKTKADHFLVLFYIPSCQWTTKFIPTFNSLVEKVANENESKLKLGHIDCTKNKQVCLDEEIEEYPTVLMYMKEDDPVKFKGVRSINNLIKFINKQFEETVLNAIEEEDDVFNAVKKDEPLKVLNDDNFDEHIKSGNHFVKFYAPWCGHCKNLAPTWEELANSLEYDASVSIGKVDCTQHRSLCQKFDVKGYPTLLWIENGKKIEKYSGARGLEQLKTYVDKMGGKSSSEEGVTSALDIGEGSALVILTGDNFDHVTAKDLTFVKFYAPWCGHCKRLAPTWDQLADKFADDATIKIGKVDCTAPESKELCTSQEVSGFPTIYIYRNGKRLEEYDGNRSLESLVSFVKKNAVQHEEL